MEKICRALTILFTMILFMQCVSKRVQTQRDLERLLPAIPHTFKPADSARLIANWTIGMRAYKSNCSKCHGVFGDGKDSIPNFSTQQIDRYKTAFLAQDSLNHAVMGKMTEEELNDVFLFLIDLKR